MGGESRDATPSRRVSEPHHHTQPKYPEPETRPRRHTEGSGLTRVVSRPEDYKNKPRPKKMVEYICFEDDEEQPDPKTCTDEPQQVPEPEESKVPLNRLESSSSRGTVESDGSSYDADDDGHDGYDSEDELKLPACYHHDAAHDDYHHQDWSSARRPDEGHDTRHSDSHSHSHRTSPVRRNDPASEGHDSQHSAPATPAAETAAKLIQAVAQHLQSHKDAYQHSGGHHNNTSEVINELLGEVVRKVADGGLNGDMVREVVREVQHVL